MSRLVAQRGRIVRVRRLQHSLAAASAVEAAGKVQSLETSSARLAQLRDDLRPREGATTGASLGRSGELAMRLDSARLGLGRSIDNARTAAAAREGRRLAARRDQESAEKLEKAAAAAAAELRERAAAAVARRMKTRLKGERDT
jgi:hypothetical protein